MLLCFFNLLPNGEYSNKSFSGKTSLPVKSSYLPTFPYDKAEILAVCVSKSY